MEKTLKSILNYHAETAHERGRLSGRRMNPATMPAPFKRYRNIPACPLPEELQFPDVALARVLDARECRIGDVNPDMLGGICNLAAGISRVRTHQDGTVFHFRTVPSAGALYPVELYVALQNVSGLNDGLYHYSPLRHSLSVLRDGRVFDERDGETVVRFYLTTIFQRSAWKYGARAYRYCLLDAGHMADNVLLATRMYGLPSRVEYDFSDSSVNRFLGVDPQFEGCLAQVYCAGNAKELPAESAARLTSSDIPSASGEASVSPPPDLLLAAHEVTSSFARCPARGVGAPLGETSPLPDPIAPASVSAAMAGRQSRRNFVPREGKTRDLVDVIGMVCHDAPPVTTDAVNVGFLAGRSRGLTPGYHRINRSNCSTTLLNQGNYLGRSAVTCLDQGWIENAAMHFVFTADLPMLEQTCGPRAYRYATLEAGRLGQRVYLTATAKQLGACGIGAYFDEEAVELLGLGQGQELLYLVAAGPVRK